MIILLYLLLTFQVSASAADIERSFTPPASPQLILLGMYCGVHFERILFSDENEVTI